MSKKIDHGGFAFPTHEIKATNGSTLSAGSDGMSLRDWFAGQAMSGALAGEPGSHLIPERLAKESYAFADAMLVASEQ